MSDKPKLRDTMAGTAGQGLVLGAGAWGVWELLTQPEVSVAVWAELQKPGYGLALLAIFYSILAELRLRFAEKRAQVISDQRFTQDRQVALDSAAQQDAVMKLSHATEAVLERLEETITRLAQESRDLRASVEKLLEDGGDGRKSP